MIEYDLVVFQGMLNGPILLRFRSNMPFMVPVVGQLVAIENQTYQVLEVNVAFAVEGTAMLQTLAIVV